jgi:hypothetical protein
MGCEKKSINEDNEEGDEYERSRNRTLLQGEWVGEKLFKHDAPYFKRDRVTMRMRTPPYGRDKKVCAANTSLNA